MGAPLFQVPVVGVVGRETRGGALLGELRSPRVPRSSAMQILLVRCKNYPDIINVDLPPSQKYLSAHRPLILWEDKPDNFLSEAGHEILAHSCIAFRDFCGGDFSVRVATRGGHTASGIAEPRSTAAASLSRAAHTDH